MRTRFYLALGVLALSLPVTLAAAASYQQLHAEAMTAYQAQQYPQMEALLRQAERLRPNFPNAVYNLASARALQSDGPGALAQLRRLERMQLAYRFWDDPTFELLSATEPFQKLAEAFKQNLLPQGTVSKTLSAGPGDFLPEGIAYDGVRGAHFLSSIHLRQVLRVEADGSTRVLADAGSGLLSAMGMQLQPGTRRLWVATSAMPEMTDFDEKDRGRAGLMVLNADTGELQAQYWAPRDGQENVFGDLIIADSGRVYTTDSVGGALYELDPKSGQFTALTKPGELHSPQGLAFAPGQGQIYLADYNKGLFRYDLRQKVLSPLKAPDDVSVYGIDGLYYFEGSLIAIQNGLRPHRVVRIALDQKAKSPKITGLEVLAANQPEFDEPTLGLLKGDGRFYFVANSHWSQVDENHKLPAETELTPPMVLSVDLK